VDVPLGSDRLNVLVEPNQVGENEVHLTVTQKSGAPARIRAMEVLFRMPERKLGPLPAKGRRLAPGHFVVQGHQLSVAGRWQLEIVARTGAFGDQRTTVSIEVNDR
jgi:copper transport protein